MYVLKIYLFIVLCHNRRHIICCAVVMPSSSLSTCYCMADSSVISWKALSSNSFLWMLWAFCIRKSSVLISFFSIIIVTRSPFKNALISLGSKCTNPVLVFTSKDDLQWSTSWPFTLYLIFSYSICSFSAYSSPAQTIRVNFSISSANSLNRVPKLINAGRFVL